jgi:cytochrome c oxidase subunit 1
VTTTERKQDPPTRPAPEANSIVGWVTSTDHKRIALLTLATALVMMLIAGGFAMMIRAQLARPQQDLLDPGQYNEFFTMHGSIMIYLVMTPFAIGIGLYLVPLQIGAPNVAAPRVTMGAYWLYLTGGLAMLSGFFTNAGAANQGWYSSMPLATSSYDPGSGIELWIVGVSMAALGEMIMAGSVLWTVLLHRAPGMTMLRIPVFSWSTVVSNLMVIGAFPFLLVSTTIIAIGRVRPDLFTHNAWNVAYQNMFWFFGHPVVYVMFFPYVGAIAEALATFSGRRFFGYKAFVLSQLLFAALSMSVWGHHLLASGQASNYYYSLTSIMLVIPAGIEYFDMLGTILGGRLRFTSSMLFALAFIPQFLIGGLTGIMIGTPTLDYQMNGSYFIVAHWHYTLAAGSLFGLFAGVYFWFPKATGRMLREGLGKLHFVLWFVGTNVTFLPMFWLGLHGMPRRIQSYAPTDGFTLDNALASAGSGLLAIGGVVFIINVWASARRPRPAGPDPWGGHTLEWATSSPPPRFNFTARYPLPPVHSYAPLLDVREEAAKR